MFAILLGIGVFFVILWFIPLFIGLLINNEELAGVSLLVIVALCAFMLASFGGYAIASLFW